MPFEGAKGVSSAGIDALHLVRVVDELAEGVGAQEPEAVAETLFELSLEGMESGISRILVDGGKAIAVLRIRQQSLGYRRGTPRHLLRPTGIGRRNAVQRFLPRRKIVIELTAHGEKTWIHGVDCRNARNETGPLVGDISRCKVGVLR